MSTPHQRGACYDVISAAPYNTRRCRCRLTVTGSRRGEFSRGRLAKNPSPRSVGENPFGESSANGKVAPFYPRRSRGPRYPWTISLVLVSSDKNAHLRWPHPRQENWLIFAYAFGTRLFGLKITITLKSALARGKGIERRHSAPCPPLNESRRVLQPP